MQDYLQGLNEAQRAAVTHTDGPTMVIAGAGSGKTKVLTTRIAHLMMSKGVDPFQILSLTFTNKAAKEMKERIAHVVGRSEAANLWMGTFHSVFARILRAEADKLGYPKDFTIYDTDDSRSVIKGILKEWQLDDKLYKPNQVHGRISIAKNNLIGPLEYLANAELMASDAASLRPKIGDIYKAYAERCFRAGAMDFDDLLFNTNLLFRDHPDAMLKYQQRFLYILVDEYQDTNLAQYNIVRTLAARHENLTVVGDDSQSIYAFRGANIQNILNFRKDYPDHGLFKLEQNYRSTKVIVGAANSLIEKNKDQIKKTTPRVTRSSCTAPAATTKRAATWPTASSKRACSTRLRTRASRSCTAPTHRAAAWRRPCASSTSPTASTAASASTSARRSRTCWATSA